MPHAENGSTTSPTVNGEKSLSQFLDVSGTKSHVTAPTTRLAASSVGLSRARTECGIENDG
jgi:hypothetical protein